MTAPYVVCIARPGRAAEVLGTYVESGDAARACDKNGPGAHIVRSGALLRYHGRTARPVLVAIEKALRENNHPALTHQGTPIEPEPEPEVDSAPVADELLAQPIETPLEAQPTPEEPRAETAPEAQPRAEPAAELAAAPAPSVHGADPEPETASKRTTTTRSAPKAPRKAARREVRDGADGTLSDLATVLRQAQRHGSIARMLSDAELGRAMRAAFEAQG
jgi:hypothetical protein